jgi:hypothetical protein
MSTDRVQLYRDAKKHLLRDPSLSDVQVAELCGQTPLVVAQFNGRTHEELAITAARREARQALEEQRESLARDQRLRNQMSIWTPEG